ncbi:MAG: hypothetical protein ABSH05_26835 [Bryobacteraceae bacterium]|jgi:hypothetical protein
MANEASTGVQFHSTLGTPEMATRLGRGMREFHWRLHDSDQYSYYYVAGKRTDGLTIKIAPEDEADEYYLGVYFADMAVFPAPEARLAMAQQVHRDVLPIVEGVRKAS